MHPPFTATLAGQLWMARPWRSLNLDRRYLWLDYFPHLPLLCLSGLFSHHRESRGQGVMTTCHVESCGIADGP
jgi:hypothetical protein